MDYLYRLIISPIEYIIEIVFIYFYRTFGSAGPALILVSLFVSLITLPLYLRADEIQRREKRKQKDMEKWVKHIKKTFTKDERFFIMQTYYREMDYKPARSLLGSLSILIQIPVFIAAYHYLSNLSVLEESFFMGISNLGVMDGLLSVGGMSINLLPILMTLINIVSGIIYTKGDSFTEKLKIIAIALVFLALLYFSPSGLVIYWICNNLFSLFKNAIMAFMEKHPAQKKMIKISMLAILMAGLLFILCIFNFREYSIEIVFTLLILVFQIPVFILAYRERKTEKKNSWILFMGSQIVLTLLIGVWMPISAIYSSPVEFVRPGIVSDPIVYMVNALIMSAGLFLIWIPFVYFLQKNRGRCVMECASVTSAVLAAAHGLLMGMGIGQISSDLVVLDFPLYPEFFDTVSMMLVFLLPICIYFIWSRRKTVLSYLMLVMILAIGFLSVKDVYATENKMREYDESLIETVKEKKIPLTRTGKNVVVLMLDRAINAYLPYMLEEKPELKEKLDGFTYYPNTLSYAWHTNIGAQPLFGGYEYTPEKLNERDDKTLKEKQTESLLMLPVLFSEEGYEVTVVDPPSAGYKWFSDLSIYDGIDGVNAMFLEGQEKEELNEEESAKSLVRDFPVYGVFRCVPFVYRTLIYDGGRYWSLKEEKSYAFLDSYIVLDNLPEITEILEEGNNTLLLMDNRAPHNSLILHQPDYVPYWFEESVNEEYSNEHHHDFIENPNYHPNMSAMLRVTEWFDHLKENGLWDNTRIIIVADHGYPNGDFPEMIHDDGLDVEAFNPLLMYKDFNAKGFTVSDDFMTNADVPSLAVQDLLKDAKNPFTGNKITMDDKYSENGQLIWKTEYFDLVEGTKTTLDLTWDDWYRVKDNIFDKENWQRVSE